MPERQEADGRSSRQVQARGAEEFPRKPLPTAPDFFLPTAPASRSCYLFVLFADITRMMASPDGPILRVPTTTASPSRMLMSVFSPVLS